MTVTDIAEDVQAQLLSTVQTVQHSVISTLEWITEQAETRLPESAVKLANRLPQVTHFVDRGFETAEQWLRQQHDFASKVATAVTPNAPESAL